MKILRNGSSTDGVEMRIEEWNENYSFMPYGSTLAFYPVSKMTHKGQFAPKAGEQYRFSFDFPSNDEAVKAFESIEAGGAAFSDYMKYWAGKPEYKDCI